MKKRTLRVIAVIITLIMLVNVIPLSVFAVENTESTETMELSVSSINGVPGETVKVNINLKNNPGLASLKFNVEYDDALTLTDVEFNSAFGSYITTPEPYTNPQTITLISPLNDVSADGTLATLTFHISEEALDEYVAKINITYNADDVYNGNYDNIALAVVNGSVTVYHGVPGDIDGDSKVNTKDAILLFRYVAGWSVDVDPAALDVNGDNKINTKDAITLFRYVAGWEDVTLHRGKICTHELTYIPEVAATCTQTGIEAYWSCELCGRKYSDSQANNQIETTIVIPISGHEYSEIWSSDSTYHWHSAICEHNEEITGKSEHTLNANGVCTICGFESVVNVTLGTPVVSKVEYDTVYWNPVENADTYTIRVNDNYECTLRGTSCSLADVKWNGNIISNYGYVTISVRANGYDNYSSSDWSDANSTYYYVPESQDSMANNLIKYSIGYGYNLIEDEYFDITLASQNSILNVKKLLTIGNCVPKVHSGGTGTSYNYESIDEFISKTKLSVEYNQETGCMLIGSLKMQISADLGFDYKSYEYNNTYVYEYKWTYKDYTVTDISDDNLLMYCLSDNFLKDIRRESISTFGLADEQLFEYLFDKYGTHAILGITTGGRYTAQYIIQTNSKDVALNVKTAFDLSTGGGGAIDQIIQKDFGIGIDLSEDLSWKNSDTEAHYITHIYGGSGGGATSASGVDSAIKDWTKSLSEDNARSVAITQNGAIALSSLISYVDASLGSKYADYVDRRADESYKQLYSQYTKPTTLPMEVVKESGQNVLKIDISNYQSIGTLANTYNPNLLDDTLTIHPTMLGKSIDKIHIIGGMGDSESQKLIDSFSIQLSREWKRNVDIVIENLGVICKSDKGFIDTSLLKNSSIGVNINYLGVNVIQTTDGTYTFRTCINSVDKNITFALPEDETLDITTVRLFTSGVCLPVAERASYVFAGWFDSNENLVADSLGNLSFEYDGDHALVHAKWIPNIYEITLDNQSATNGGSSKFYEQYTVGMFADFEGSSALTEIIIPSKTGFVFGGYYESVENNSTSTAVGTNQYVSPEGIITTCFTSFNADTTLYALWIPQVFEISLDNQGATISGTVSYYEKYISGIYGDRECNSDLIKIDVPKKNGFTFSGYFEGINGTGVQRIKADGTIIATNDTYTENVTLYALWTINTYEITLDANGANNNGTAVYYEKYTEANYSDVKATNVITNITIPEKTGYTFEGYYLDGIQYIDAEGTIIASTTAFYDNVTLTARWIANTYFVSYNLSESSIKTIPELSEKSTEVVYNTKSQLIVPIAEFYEFTGWYLDKDLYTQITDNTGKMINAWNIDESRTLYAGWKKVDKYIDYVYIKTKEEFVNISPTGNSLLVSDIDMENYEWSAIELFGGKLDGAGHTISNMAIKSSSAQYLGLFAKNIGCVENIFFNNIVVNYDVSNSHEDVCIGIIAGINTGTIKKCVIQSSIITCWLYKNIGTDSVIKSSVGGIAGRNESVISECSVIGTKILGQSSIGVSDGSVEANSGGIVGMNIGNGTVENCASNFNEIKSVVYGGKTWTATRYRTYARAGGIAGYNSSSINNSVVSNNSLKADYSTVQGSYPANHNSTGEIAGKNDGTAS